MIGILRGTLFGSRVAIVCSAWLVLIILGALFGAQLSGWDPESIDWDALESPPDGHHWFSAQHVKDAPT